MSAQVYQTLLERLSSLEDQALGQAAQTALTQSQMAGSDSFTSQLKRLASDGET